jgi:hypothetical protein
MDIFELNVLHCSFTPDWEKGTIITVLTVTASDYLVESRTLLDGYFFEQLVSIMTFRTRLII